VAGIKEIKTWILAFGSLARVLEPASLVKDIKDDLGKSLRSYTWPSVSYPKRF
jgi:predicted DNA-binding transcriptional regulator YafY